MKNILFALICFVYTLNIRAQESHVLENKDLKARVHLNDAALIGLESKSTGWNVISTATYGQSFEINVKLSDGAFHVVNGKSQNKPEIKINKDELIFVWDGIKVGSSVVDIVFEGRIKITDRGLIYDGVLKNNSDAVVEQLSWPFIGEVSIPEKTDQLLFQYMNYTKFNTNELYPGYSGRGWSNLPEHSFTLIHNRKQGLYLSSEDVKFEEYIRCEYETLPTTGFSSMAGEAGSKKNNGERNQMKIQVKVARMLYLQPKLEVVFMPVVLTPYSGDWHKGADIYKKWRKTWYVAPHRPEWVKKVNAWQQLQINSSESNINFKIKDLNQYVDECVKYGVDAIQLTGWTRGGQDRGLPSHDLDPRLGTVDEFKRVIADANKKGIKILLFTKFTWVDMTADLYPDWASHVAWNNQGDTCRHPGYNYNTYTQLLGINTRRFGIFCMMDKDLRIKLHAAFQKCLDLGAPGMVYDENQHHAGTMLCFNPNHGHQIPGFVYKGADLLGREFMAMCKQSNPDFLMVGEGPYDIQSQYYSTYTRADYNHEPVLRYIDSDIPIACAVTDHYDKNQINMCLANQYAISYESRNFKGHLWEFPRVIAYGKQVDDLRKKYSDYLWEAEFKDTIGAVVSGKDLKYTVFARKTDGKKAVVVYNTNTKEENHAEISIVGSGLRQVIFSPEKQTPVAFGGTVVIAPQSAIVVIEK
ncbi:MAG: DUF6259 domain-containing protein [Dysgonamonadaceae bacterium]|jgi:hypothetical protein|nr:DUF6259 domain-containing protein [Dysgonamonadaceae bacterium]